jgi:hypothetical protein
MQHDMSHSSSTAYMSRDCACCWGLGCCHLHALTAAQPPTSPPHSHAHRTWSQTPLCSVASEAQAPDTRTCVCYASNALKGGAQEPNTTAHVHGCDPTTSRTPVSLVLRCMQLRYRLPSQLSSAGYCLLLPPHAVEATMTPAHCGICNGRYAAHATSQCSA